jgi:mono/diheme cytochrome c family protein
MPVENPATAAHSNGAPLRCWRLRRLGHWALMLSAISLIATGADAAERNGKVSAGETLARDACSACHQVSLRQKPPPPVFDQDEQAGVRAPSFMVLARDPRKNATYLRKVITRPHYPMREQSFDKDDLDAIIAYIRSLRPHLIGRQ